jgi:hypothetical protein
LEFDGMDKRRYMKISISARVELVAFSVDALNWVCVLFKIQPIPVLILGDCEF